jgi:hypothetical protein
MMKTVRSANDVLLHQSEAEIINHLLSVLIHERQFCKYCGWVDVLQAIQLRQPFANVSFACRESSMMELTGPGLTGKQQLQPPQLRHSLLHTAKHACFLPWSLATLSEDHFHNSAGRGAKTVMGPKCMQYSTCMIMLPEAGSLI